MCLATKLLVIDTLLSKVSAKNKNTEQQSDIKVNSE